MHCNLLDLALVRAPQLGFRLKLNIRSQGCQMSKLYSEPRFTKPFIVFSFSNPSAINANAMKRWHAA
jgi:hypothetical protein